MTARRTPKAAPPGPSAPGPARAKRPARRAPAGLGAKYFRALIENATDLITVVDGEGVIQYVSPSVERVLGWAAADLLGHNVFELLHPDDQPQMQQIFTSFRAQPGTGAQVEFRVRNPAGEWLTLESVGNNLLAAPAVGAIVYNSRDVTARKQAEAALRESEERYRRFTETSPYGIVVHQDGQVVFANLAAARLLGAEHAADLVGIPIQHLVEPERWHVVQERIQRVLNGETESLPADERFRRLDGSSLPVQVITTPFTHQGRPAIQKILQDITERQHAKEILEASERRLSLIFETVADVLFLLAVEPPDGYRFVSVNSTFLSTTGLTREQVIGQRVEDVLPPASQALVLEKYRQAIHEKKTVRWEEVSPYPTGNLYGEVAVTPAHDAAGVVTHLIGSVHDITQIRQAEHEIRQFNQELERRVTERTAQLAAANKELESFSYSVSHDLRAPLRAISGFAEIIARRHRAALPEEGQHYFDNIVQASERMSQLIDDLLTYARLGRQAVRRERVPLAELLPALQRDLSTRLQASGSTLELAGDLPVVLGDHTLLGQVFGNLLENALTYRQPGQAAHIRVDWEAAGSAAVVRVRDDGIGIPAEFQDKIFNIFQRLHSEDEYPGTGIGLATVKKAAEMLGGRVWVESAPGAGSTFLVQLPRE